MNDHEDNASTISPELMARIETLEDESLKANILRYLGRRWKREKSDEQIFEEMVEERREYVAQRTMREACTYRWRNEELVAFVKYFETSRPKWYADYLSQERNGRDIDGELATNMRLLVKEWLPGVGWNDSCELFRNGARLR